MNWSGYSYGKLGVITVYFEIVISSFSSFTFIWNNIGVNTLPQDTVNPTFNQTFVVPSNNSGNPLTVIMNGDGSVTVDCVNPPDNFNYYCCVTRVYGI